MLGKLMKYEFKATSRFMLLMYVVLFAISAIISLSIRFNIDELFEAVSNRFELGTMLLAVISAMVLFMFFAMNVVVLCGMFFYSISRFKNNMLGDEGYLMHTLPVKVRDNILAKTFVSTIWTVLSVIAVIIAYIILFLGFADTNTFNILFRALSKIDVNMLLSLGEVFLVLAELLILLLAAAVQMYLHIYASMAVGYSSNTHRAAKSIGVYILISIVLNIVETTALFPFLTFGLITDGSLNSIHFTMLYSIVITIIWAVVFYFITEYFMKKKLNLQ